MSKKYEIWLSSDTGTHYLVTSESEHGNRSRREDRCVSEGDTEEEAWVAARERTEAPDVYEVWQEQAGHSYLVRYHRDVDPVRCGAHGNKSRREDTLLSRAHSREEAWKLARAPNSLMV